MEACFTAVFFLEFLLQCFVKLFSYHTPRCKYTFHPEVFKKEFWLSFHGAIGLVCPLWWFVAMESSVCMSERAMLWLCCSPGRCGIVLLLQSFRASDYFSGEFVDGNTQNV